MIEALEKTPTLSQRDLAGVLGFSLGKVNYCLKALVNKGLVKASHFVQNPHKAEYAYLLTPKGMRSKAVLTAQFLERKVAQYEALKAEIELLKTQAGYPQSQAGRAKARHRVQVEGQPQGQPQGQLVGPTPDQRKRDLASTPKGNAKH